MSASVFLPVSWPIQSDALGTSLKRSGHQFLYVKYNFILGPIMLSDSVSKTYFKITST